MIFVNCPPVASGIAGSSSGPIQPVSRRVDAAVLALARLVMALWAVASGALANATSCIAGSTTAAETGTPASRPVFRAIVTRRSAVSESSELCGYKVGHGQVHDRRPRRRSRCLPSWGYLRHRQSNSNRHAQVATGVHPTAPPAAAGPLHPDAKEPPRRTPTPRTHTHHDHLIRPQRPRPDAGPPPYTTRRSRNRPTQALSPRRHRAASARSCTQKPLARRRRLLPRTPNSRLAPACETCLGDRGADVEPRRDPYRVNLLVVTAHPSAAPINDKR